MPLLSKSNVSTARPSGNRISGGGAPARARRLTPRMPSVASALANTPRRDIAVWSIATLLVELLRDRLPLRPLDQGDLGDGMIPLHVRHHAHRPESLVLLHRAGRRRLQRALRLRHGLALGLRRLQVVVLGDRLG